MSTPFGKPFKYTPTLKFTSEKKPWWKFWGGKQPVAWLAQGQACDDDGEPANLIPQAWMLHRFSGEVRISPVEPHAITPIYDQDLVNDLIIAQEHGRIWVDDKDS